VTDVPRRESSTPPRRRRYPRGRVALVAVSLVLTGSVAALVAAAGVPASAGKTGASTFPGGAYFNLACGFSHRNNDDPIVFPGQPGRSHNHTYIGNRDVTATATPASLRQGRETTCEIADDLSTYWVPTLYVGTQPVIPYAGVVYYVRLTPQRVSSFPPDLKMVAGNSAARRAQRTDVASWSCGGIGASKRFAAVPACREDQLVELRVRFPDCWNGRTSDSPNHASHMAYSTGGRCPSSHPVAVPTLIVVLLYPPVPRRAQPSAGRFAAHADFMNGWNPDSLAKFVASLNH
jgi:hypothetical protein